MWQADPWKLAKPPVAYTVLLFPCYILQAGISLLFSKGLLLPFNDLGLKNYSRKGEVVALC
jgi:hypothetical protein